MFDSEGYCGVPLFGNNSSSLLSEQQQQHCAQHASLSLQHMQQQKVVMNATSINTYTYKSYFLIFICIFSVHNLINNVNVNIINNNNNSNCVYSF